MIQREIEGDTPLETMEILSTYVLHNTRVATLRLEEAPGHISRKPVSVPKTKSVRRRRERDRVKLE